MRGSHSAADFLVVRRLRAVKTGEQQRKALGVASVRERTIKNLIKMVLTTAKAGANRKNIV